MQPAFLQCFVSKWYSQLDFLVLGNSLLRGFSTFLNQRLAFYKNPLVLSARGADEAEFAVRPVALADVSHPNELADNGFDHAKCDCFVLLHANEVKAGTGSSDKAHDLFQKHPS